LNKQKRLKKIQQQYELSLKPSYLQEKSEAFDPVEKGLNKKFQRIMRADVNRFASCQDLDAILDGARIPSFSSPLSDQKTMSKVLGFNDSTSKPLIKLESAVSSRQGQKSARKYE
jgi:hypothetical protein